MIEFDEFRKLIIKADLSRNYEITNSLGTYDAFKWYRKHKPKDKKYVLKEVLYFAIIRKINNLLIEYFLKGNDLRLPCGMGRIELAKFNPEVYFKDGVLVNKHYIDWHSTLKLWYEYPEEKENKTLVRDIDDTKFVIKYNRKGSTYKYSKYYKFTPHRTFYNKLRNKVKTEGMEAFNTK